MYKRQGEYAGIGAVISKRGEGIIIREPYKDSPADKAGLLPGDIIISIDGKTIKGKTSSEVSELLRGQPGKEILIKVKREGFEKPLEKKAIREKIQLPSVQMCIRDRAGTYRNPYYFLLLTHWQ